jgi:hypothetical protein
LVLVNQDLLSLKRPAALSRSAAITKSIHSLAWVRFKLPMPHPVKPLITLSLLVALVVLVAVIPTIMLAAAAALVDFKPSLALLSPLQVIPSPLALAAVTMVLALILSPLQQHRQVAAQVMTAVLITVVLAVAVLAAPKLISIRQEPEHRGKGTMAAHLRLVEALVVVAAQALRVERQQTPMVQRAA